MSKYSRLGQYLESLETDEVEFTFQEIEEMLGFSLPESSRRHRAWWSNDLSHVQAKSGWLNYGWNVLSAYLTKRVVRFKRSSISLQSRESRTSPSNSQLSPTEFEKIAQTVMSRHFKVDLHPGEILGVKKLFDMVSEDGGVVGDAKYLTMVLGRYLPPAKFSVIAEHVWLLEHTKAKKKFLLFGNDRRVPVEWRRRYGNLVKDVDFYFYDVDDDHLENLNNTSNEDTASDAAKKVSDRKKGRERR